MKSELFTSRLDEKIIFEMETHVGAKSALLRRLFLPAAQKAAGRVAPLLLLPAKSLVCSGCSLASAVATPPLHYQLFADRGLSFKTLHPIRDHRLGGGRELFCPRWAFSGELRFCEAKWEFLKLPSNFSGESPERSAGDLPSPTKSHAAPLLFACKRSWSPVGTVQDRPRRQPRPHNATACYDIVKIS